MLLEAALGIVDDTSYDKDRLLRQFRGNALLSTCDAGELGEVVLLLAEFLLCDASIRSPAEIMVLISAWLQAWNGSNDFAEPLWARIAAGKARNSGIWLVVMVVEALRRHEGAQSVLQFLQIDLNDDRRSFSELCDRISQPYTGDCNMQARSVRLVSAIAMSLSEISGVQVGARFIRQWLMRQGRVFHGRVDQRSNILSTGLAFPSLIVQLCQEAKVDRLAEQLLLASIDISSCPALNSNDPTTPLYRIYRTLCYTEAKMAGFEFDAKRHALLPENAPEFLLIYVVVAKWIVTHLGHPLILDVCESFVFATRNFRDRVFHTTAQERDFFRQFGTLYCSSVVTAGVHEVSRLQKSGRTEDARSAQVQMTEWCEHLRFSSLVNRLTHRTTMAASSNASNLLHESKAESWPFEQLPPDVTMRDGYLPPAIPGASVIERLDEIGQGRDSTMEPQRSSQENPFRKKLRQGNGSMASLIPVDTVHVRVEFDHSGRLHWWAIDSESQILATSNSQGPVRTRIGFAQKLFDLENKLIWHRHDQLRHIGKGLELGHRQVLSMLRKNLNEDSTLSMDEADALSSTIDLLAQTFPDFARLLRGVIRQRIEYQKSANSQDVARFIGYLVDDPARTPSAIEKWRRDSLDGATRAFAALVSEELELSCLWEACTDRDWQSTDMIFTLPPELFAMPISLLNANRSPLFEAVASITINVSLTFRQVLADASGSPVETGHSILSAHWLPKRERGIGLLNLHRSISATASRHGADLYSLGDQPEASAANIHGLLSAKRNTKWSAFVGGHGTDSLGVSLIDGTWVGDIEDDLRNVDLLYLVACGVGRLIDDDEREVVGLLVDLAASGVRSIISSKWPISDTESACLAAEFLEQYLLRPHGTFARSRALNRARRKLLSDADHNYRPSLHVASAFDLFGVG